MDSGWVYDSAAYRFNLLKRTFKIPLAAFMKPEQQQQQMIASFSEQSGMDSNWSFKCLEDCGWDYDRAAYVFTELKGIFKIPLAAFIEPEQQRQQIVASFSEQSGMDSNWSLKCLMDSGWVYDSAAYRFNLLKRTFKIPLAAFMKPEQQQQQMVASFSEQSGMDSRWSFKCLEDCGWDYDRAAYVFIEFKAAGKIPLEAFVK
jgi:siderophore synthetase component